MVLDRQFKDKIRTNREITKMKIGDVVWITAASDDSKRGVGLYLGKSHRADSQAEKYFAFLWKGRVATFDKPYWLFEVINQTKHL